MKPDLAEACPHDGRPIGEHTLEEWWDDVHSAPHTDLDYEEVPAGPIMVKVAPDDERVLSDTIVARASVVSADVSGGLTVQYPALLLDFQVGEFGGPPRTVQTAAFVSQPDVMRKVGRIIRDAANGAANAAERAR